MIEVNNFKGKKYKLISCDNPSSAGFNFIGLTNHLEVVSLGGEGTNTESLFFFGSLRSSLIKDIKEEVDKGFKWLEK